MEKDIIIIRYGEIFLKSSFVMKKMVHTLIDNIRTQLSREVKDFKITQERGRIYLESNDKEKTLVILKKIFGIVSFSPAKKIKLNDLNSYIEKNSKKMIGSSNSFSIRVKRIGKHEFTSRDLEKKLGNIIVKNTGKKVDLVNPEKTIYVEVRNDDVYIFTEVIRGAGGLPVGVTGKVLVLLSGGIDSPVAAWKIMKRGCRVVFLHFNKGRFGVDDEEKVIKLVEKLKEWYPRKLKIYFVDHEKSLSIFSKQAPYTCVLCKRMMVRIASMIAGKEKCDAIITGDSLGEVASQTLKNIKVITSASNIPIFRPLITMDKEEIIQLAKKIGTYEISISQRDVCRALPLKPKTKSYEDKIVKIEEKININDLVYTSLEKIKIKEI